MTPSEAASNGTPSGDAGDAGTGDAVPPRDVVVVGASAGGVEALARFVAALPADLAATVLVVLHIPARAPSALASILDRRGALPARTAVDAQRLEAGVVLVAPPDHHLVVRPENSERAGDPDTALTVATVRGPRENGHRPCIDALFRTAAQHLGPRVVAVVLSGSDDDGTAGALAVRQRGGLVYAQSAADALYATMPQSVVRRAGAEAQAPASELAALVAEVVGRSASARSVRAVPAVESDPELAEEAAVDENWPPAVLGEPLGEASGFVCP